MSLGVLAPAIGAVIIRLGKNSKLVGLFQGEQGKGNVRAKKLVSSAGDEFVFVPTAGNASFTVETAGDQQFVKVADYYPGNSHTGWARIWVDHRQDLDLVKINTKVSVPSIPDAKAMYTGSEGMNRDLLAELKATLGLEERSS